MYHRFNAKVAPGTYWQPLCNCGWKGEDAAYLDCIAQWKQHYFEATGRESLA